MKKNKRILLAGAALLSAALLSACGSKQTDSTQAGTQEVSRESATEESTAAAQEASRESMTKESTTAAQDEILEETSASAAETRAAEETESPAESTAKESTAAETVPETSESETEASETESSAPLGPVLTAADIQEGVYDIEVESSSSMFKVTSCRLTVEKGYMTADLTLSGTGYIYLYMGPASEAEDGKGDVSAYEEKDGAYTFSVPVEALNQEIACAAYSKAKEKWYDRTLIFRSDSIPAEALSRSMAGAQLPALEDGEYLVDVILEGGSGRSTVTSPARLTVADGKVTAEIVWSSPNYDYMKVADVQYDPVSTEGNAAFEIPVLCFDAPMAVIADTTAMSTPHEVEYTLTFDSASIHEP